ncbi:TPA: hypothetical protein PWY45_002434, partial [Mannheimia haemolytica]|uniref:Uncharacterized protein n=4 Tax=root TaxID=1 RepID=A0A0M3LQC1_9CAUD|nr:hypothetical protein [Mannheimia haemolytica]YP_009207783.1 hypothetical protein AVV63_gp30 [Mannheimia phage vB_MhM_587AP1]YP_009785015.1 hypothetical protein HOR01_gp30 [Mannheimia phage vB_MhM_1127AP1]AJA72954.1 hypothetical protein 587AP1_30 [Mannheimia phage vB_MhM_587AP1]AJA73082.1 hypothetical protein 1127AP1_30 [Mannheimia phage vB_MhM_1127AP1]KYL19023.1 hypothetical protein AC571_00010 [Mannheimia haemolytica]KYL20998.1 hypothetical protein AC574_12060 [Mannheimia haemolytica]MDW
MTQNVPYGNPNNLYDDNQKWEGRMSVKKGKVHIYLKHDIRQPFYVLHGACCGYFECTGMIEDWYIYSPVEWEPLANLCQEISSNQRQLWISGLLQVEPSKPCEEKIYRIAVHLVHLRGWSIPGL